MTTRYVKAMLLLASILLSWCYHRLWSNFFMEFDTGKLEEVVSLAHQRSLHNQSLVNKAME